MITGFIFDFFELCFESCPALCVSIPPRFVWQGRGVMLVVTGVSFYATGPFFHLLPHLEVLRPPALSSSVLKLLRRTCESTCFVFVLDVFVICRAPPVMWHSIACRNTQARQTGPTLQSFSKAEVATTQTIL